MPQYKWKKFSIWTRSNPQNKWALIDIKIAYCHEAALIYRFPNGLYMRCDRSEATYRVGILHCNYKDQFFIDAYRRPLSNLNKNE